MTEAGCSLVALETERVFGRKVQAVNFGVPASLDILLAPHPTS